MSIDRAAAVRQAEKLLGQGKLEQAIAVYVRLLDDQPTDWNTAKLLGDLYVRAGQVEQAVGQFARIAEHLCREGFLPRASALYKKVLKLQPDSDHALVRAGELAAQQGLLADARAFFSTAAARRRQHGDARGALEVAVRLGALDTADVPARLASARARVELGDTPGALHEYTALAAWLTDQAREVDAVEPLRAVLELDPGSAAAARDLTRILVSAGRFDEAAPYLTPENIGSDPTLTRLVAQRRFDQGDMAAGLELVDRLLLSDDEAPAVVAEMVELLAAARPESAWVLTERLVGASVERTDWRGATVALRRFIARVPHHVTALTRLLDACVDGALDDEVLNAQALLADAYLAVGAAGDAKYVAEDLLTRQPWDRAHYVRMRAALAAEGPPDPDRALADWLAETPEFGTTVEDDDPSVQWLLPDAGAALPAGGPVAPAPHEASLPDPPPAPVGVSEAPSASPAVAKDDRRNPHAVNIDLTLGTARPDPADLDSVFAAMRAEALRRPIEEATDVAFTRGAAMVAAGELEQCVEPLSMAARSPRRRFAAATLLAQVFERQQQKHQAIEWLGHAVDAPGLSETERFDTLLRMADLLEQTGEPASALALCLELQASAGSYKDLSVRIARLSRAQVGG